MLKEFQNNRYFAYYASREDHLTEDKVSQFRSTLLDSQYLAIVEEVPEEEKILEDQDLSVEGILCDNESRADKLHSSQSVTSKLKIIKWNFPVMAKLYIQILEEYVTSSTVEDLKGRCSKVPSFAGFWYESLFFTHHKQRMSSFTICCNANTKLRLCIEKVLQQETVDATIQQNTLYELRTSHPIVNALGYLHETDDTYWLVFIQISLQRYEDHQSLCDLFKRVLKNSKV